MTWLEPLALLALGLAAGACQDQPVEQEKTGPRGSLSETVNRADRGSARPAAAPAPAPAAVPAGSVNGSAAPARGSAQRSALMDAVRPTIETALRSPVEFVVQRAEVADGWALVVADPQRPGGGDIDAGHLDPEEERDGLTVNAFLRFQNGRWNLVDHVIGPTDVWYCGHEGPPSSLTGC
jgi:hypothetical protein